MDRMTESIPPLPGAAPVIGLAHKALHGDDVLLWERLKQWSLDTNDLGGIAKAWFGPIFFIYSFSQFRKILFKPFFELIFELVDEGILDEDEARNEVDTVVAAGYDTTQTTLLVTLLVLGSRDDVQEKVVEELLVDEGSLDEDEARSEVDTAVAAGYDTTQTTLLVTLLVLGSRGDVQEKVVEELIDDSVDEGSLDEDEARSEVDTAVAAGYDTTQTTLLVTLLVLGSRGDVQEKVVEDDVDKDDVGDLQKNEGSLDEDEARSEVDTVVAAGYDTTQTTLLVTLLVLGSRGDVQEKVVEELTEVFSDAEEEVTKAHLSKLVYMEAVIKETLRLHPVIPLMGRVVDKDVKFEKFTLPAGSVVTLNTWGLHRHRGWGTDADVYRPERWLNASTVPDKSFAAFAMGRRSCIGRSRRVKRVPIPRSIAYQWYTRQEL
ncbi:hypothetical protein JYU34_019293 [Plutella xylostella]|uniref:Cytochrome P450 n=1 Tax=Plutella xylostella TaxID=51655 RepID=A0ABQ7PWH2_PLUXY|nr:hypothetical protein JYU34_019293 [Plutella xylostella]